VSVPNKSFGQVGTDEAVSASKKDLHSMKFTPCD